MFLAPIGREKRRLLVDFVGSILGPPGGLVFGTF